MLRACSSVLVSGVPPRGLLAILGFNCRPLPLFFTWWVSPRRPRWVHGTAVVSGWGQGTHHAVRGSLVHVGRATGHTRSLGSWSWRTSVTRRMTWKNRAALILDRNTHLVVHGATQLGRYGSPHLIGHGSSQLTWHGSPNLRFRHGGAAVLKVRRGQRVLTRRATELHLGENLQFAICNSHLWDRRVAGWTQQGEALETFQDFLCHLQQVAHIGATLPVKGCNPNKCRSQRLFSPG